MERDHFLSRVAAAVVGRSVPDSPRRTPLPPPRQGDLVELFTDRAREVGVVVHGPIDRHRVAGLVARAAAGARTFISWDDLPAPGVVATLSSTGMTRVEVDASGRGQVDALERLHQVDLGVTAALVGLAESGSVVLSHGPGRPRLASLAPDLHVALLEVDAIVTSLAHWAGQGPDPVSATANLVVITGPSRSGDIELELNLGVHGPGQVRVVLIG